MIIKWKARPAYLKSLRKIQLIRLTKQFWIYSGQSAIPALPPVVIHSVMTIYRRLWSLDATPVWLFALAFRFANIISVQRNSATGWTKIRRGVFWNSRMFFFSHSCKLLIWRWVLKNSSHSFKYLFLLDYKHYRFVVKGGSVFQISSDKTKPQEKAAKK